MLNHFGLLDSYFIAFLQHEIQHIFDTQGQILPIKSF
jgi:hypothetical protein